MDDDWTTGRTYWVTGSSYWVTGLPSVELRMMGDLSRVPEDQEDDTKRSHFDQYFNFRIDENTDEFVIRIARRSDAPPGHTNVAVKIEGGLTEQPDGSVLFDGGYNENGVSKFGLSFEITHEAKEEEPEDEPEEKEIKYFYHPEHKLRLVNEYEYTNGFSDETYCSACTERIVGSHVRWVYACPERRCYYGVHSACGLLATKIRHPSHPEHELKLCRSDRNDSKSCYVCKGRIQKGLNYYCEQCDFDIHSLCPELQENDHRVAAEEVDAWNEDGSGLQGHGYGDYVAPDEAFYNSYYHVTSAQQLPNSQRLNSQTWMLRQQLINSQMQLNNVRQIGNVMADIGSDLLESVRR